MTGPVFSCAVTKPSFFEARSGSFEQRFSSHPDNAVKNALWRLMQLAEVIERDVMVSGHVPKLKPLK
jgi:hypothetical protein